MKFLILLILLVGCTSDIVVEETETKEELKCPRGQVNDPYPGQCALYVDADNSGFCDYSES